MKETFIYYAVGYLYSLLIGTWLTYYLADYTGKAISEFKEGEYYRWWACPELVDTKNDAKYTKSGAE